MKYLGKKFATTEVVGRGKRKRSVLERRLVLAIVWIEKGLDEPAYCADCVELDEDGEIPAASCTAGGSVLQVKKVDFDFLGLDANIRRYEGF